MVVATLFLSMTLFIILSVPVGIAIGMASVVAILVGQTLSPGFVAQTLVTSTDSFPIMAIPLFILAGELMGAGGVSRRILEAANCFFGRMTGGLAIVTVVVCMFFAAVSGSGPATVAAVGGMVVPTMLKAGYTKSFTLALIATAGSIGVIIPPSIPMVIFGVSTSTSISDMFLGGFGPGMLIGFALISWCYIYSKRRGWRGLDEPFSWRHTGHSLWDAKWALINPIIILGGIYGGVFTPTEAAAVAASYAFFIGAFVHRELNLRTLFRSIGTACSTTGTTMVILGCASAFTRILTIEQVPVQVSEMMIQLTENPILLLMMINMLLLMVGCVMDTTPAILVLAPILFPVAMSFGIEPVHFGLIMVVNLAIGFITPPLGINLFVAARVGDSTLGVVARGLVPFLITMLVCLLLITYVPDLTMFMVNTFGL
ncbi:TRAP transporter large permease [Roseospira visakhapatnamensis]|uniref:TRAP transporter large permease protein n=1 Tax=Roseospira visakhapatnamensis TaxID=390880 RepID=A0A7W6WB30_9PROT|nr:TRAP transporter large permease [Roseospira visakhapatnamensis]MBB4267096.1 C4-dicarboxylate transporter DctM subunit [Roseospira visakhapatnamensis]